MEGGSSGGGSSGGGFHQKKESRQTYVSLKSSFRQLSKNQHFKDIE